MTIWAARRARCLCREALHHNVHEGRIAVETARKHERIVQHGTQSRSGSNFVKLEALVRSGQARQAPGLAPPLLQATSQHRP